MLIRNLNHILKCRQLENVTSCKIFQHIYFVALSEKLSRYSDNATLTFLCYLRFSKCLFKKHAVKILTHQCGTVN